ncbi:MAG: HAD family hydrolase [Thermodesulfobacteriota bacterium]
MTYHAGIFDLDGTLLNTLADLGNSVNRVLVDMEFPPHPIEDYRLFVGNGAEKLILRALPENNRDKQTVSACLNAFLEDYHKNWNINTRPYQGIPELLDALKQRGFKLAVLSNKPHDIANLCVSELLPSRLDMVLGHCAGASHKPNPAGALEIARRLNIAPEAFLYFGDSGVDMETALAAHMFPVGVLWGFREAVELERSGARVLISHPLEGLDLL